MVMWPFDQKELLSLLIISLIKLIVVSWDILTYPIYLLAYQPWKVKKSRRGNQIEILFKDEESLVYRSILPETPKEDDMIHESTMTLVDLIQNTAATHSHKKSLGSRAILKPKETRLVSKGGVQLKMVDQGEYEWLSFNEVHAQSTCFGQGLRDLGCIPGDKILIFAESSAKWLMSAFGSFKNSMTLVTIYTNLRDEGVLHCINQTDARIIITSQDLVDRLLGLLLPSGHTHTVIYLEKNKEVKEKEEGGSTSLNIYSFDEILDRGSKSLDSHECKASPNDLAVIMYTSGSTGLPKGVLLSHANIICNIKGITHFINSNLEDIERQTYIGYLPLAHIFELCVELAFFGRGVPIGFSGPSTLLTSSPLIREGQMGDICALNPTYMAMVPLIAERIYKGITQKISERGEVTRKIFDFCYEYKSKWRQFGFDTPLLNRIVFQRVNHILGRKLTLIVSGGAPLSPKIQDFMQIVFNCKLSQGYGLTETSGGFMLGQIDDNALGEVGHPFIGSYVKLVNWEEGKYSVSDEPCPRGEIHVGGGLVAKGYYKMSGETEKHFYESGVRWFKTGDIGQLLPTGALRIIDRKKDILKLLNGEYVSLGKIETVLSTHPSVHAICVHGDSEQNALVALLIPNEESLRHHIPELSSEEDLFKECTFIRSKVIRLLIEYSNNKLKRFEIPKKICLVRGPWSPENGLVTSSLKLKRKAIQLRYQDQINRMFEEMDI